ncbi:MULTISPECIES: hypothetical protein [Actinosynnema]|uniref:Uncharacterized protein n=1 Tax=Actinosynnema pretiosum TaxID=42197 RepID=A0A290ZD17_9PSEU|nr:hypothetical protein [Actinosynnema pretiosum]ATE56886.1 hypothetical protein CNX65_29335 [Actinosynnema pretiosum]
MGSVVQLSEVRKSSNGGPEWRVVERAEQDPEPDLKTWAVSRLLAHGCTFGLYAAESGRERGDGDEFHEDVWLIWDGTAVMGAC